MAKANGQAQEEGDGEEGGRLNGHEQQISVDEQDAKINDPSIREHDDGSVEVSLDGKAIDDRATRHSADDDGDVATHDDAGRPLSADAREELRAQRREEKKRRRTAGREREDRLRADIQARDATISSYEQRIRTLEQRGSAGELQFVEQKIQEFQDAGNFFQQRVAEAVSKNDGAAVAEASAKMTEARMRHQELLNIRQQVIARQQMPQPLDPRVKAGYDAWMSKNSWYKATDQMHMDSRIALTIDDMMLKQGWNPSDPRYWTELDRRCKEQMPHNYRNQNYDDDDDEDGEQTTRGGREERRERRPPPRTPSAGGASADNSGAAGTFRLSKAQVDAIKQAGMWEDKAKRSKMIARYVQQAREQRAAR